MVRVFVFCFGFVTFYFIEVGTLILIRIQDCKKNSVWYIVLVSQLKSQFKKKIVFDTIVLVFRFNFYYYYIIIIIIIFLFFSSLSYYTSLFIFSFFFLFFPPPPTYPPPFLFSSYMLSTCSFNTQISPSTLASMAHHLI